MTTYTIIANGTEMGDFAGAELRVVSATATVRRTRDVSICDADEAVRLVGQPFYALRSGAAWAVAELVGDDWHADHTSDDTITVFARRASGIVHAGGVRRYTTRDAALRALRALGDDEAP